MYIRAVTDHGVAVPTYLPIGLGWKRAREFGKGKGKSMDKGKDMDMDKDKGEREGRNGGKHTMYVCTYVCMYGMVKTHAILELEAAVWGQASPSPSDASCKARREGGAKGAAKCLGGESWGSATAGTYVCMYVWGCT